MGKILLKIVVYTAASRTFCTEAAYGNVVIGGNCVSADSNRLVCKILKVKEGNEIKWINKVSEVSDESFAIINWKAEELKGDNLINLLK